MRRLTLLLIAFALAFVLGTAPARAAGSYTVQPGDSLFSIAARFNVSISELATINKIYDVNAIYPGQVLILPAALGAQPAAPAQQAPVYGPPAPVTYPSGTVVTTTTTYTYYVVQPGDTLASIAARLGSTASAILSANYLPNPNLLYIGARLVVPKISSSVVIPAPKPVYGNFYVVQAGDNLFAIAARFKRDVYAIARVNNLLNLNAIYAGQALLIP